MLPKPYYQDAYVTIYNKSCTDMNEIPDESVQCVVTSPPYWGLRKYDGKQIIPEWGCAFGMEPTPELYIEHTIQILREIKRVLRDDGVVFWNIGDSYAGSGMGAANYPGDYPKQNSNTGTLNVKGRAAYRDDIIKPKDLCLIPERFAIAAQQQGWWVRSRIIWYKHNPMPESVKDRPTNAHETIWMLTKSKSYYWDIDAVREPMNYPDRIYSSDTSNHKTTQLKDIGNRSTVGLHDGRTQYGNPELGRNIRDVWEISTKPYPEAHFAVFPEEIPRKCIMAATKSGDTVLDPFGGSGTTISVAKKLNRKGIMYDLSREYCELAVDRVRQGVLELGI